MAGQHAREQAHGEGHLVLSRQDQYKAEQEAAVLANDPGAAQAITS
jgi:hypothetical protein